MPKTPHPDEEHKPRLPDSIARSIANMPLSRMENTTFAMPSIIDSHDMGLRTVFTVQTPKRKRLFNGQHDHLGYRLLCLEWMTKLLNDRQNTERFGVAFTHSIRNHKESEDFLTAVVIGDESWCRHYELFFS
ncbi:hypothetical protein TNCV_4440371 [Trichonephila clavipes]|nr:hypothetical protein TNCV_4440371 [Trichonephila clavipes]